MLTKDKQVQSRILGIVGHRMAASATIYKGALTVLNAAGDAEKAKKATGLTTVGIAREGVDNSAGKAGDKIVEVRNDECARLNNDATNPVTRLHIGSSCYIIDDETVTSVSTGSSKAGTVRDLDDKGVWISF